MEDRRVIAKKIASWFHDGHVINLGVGVPILVADYITDNVVIQSENGLLGVGEAIGGLEPEAPYFNAAGATVSLIPGASVFDITTSFGMIRSGRLRATVLGCFEVSQFGDLANMARPGSYPGMGGAMDLVSGIDNVIVATDHCTRDGKPKIVAACTLPLTGVGVVKTIVTELAVFTVSRTEGLTLVEHRAGVSVETIRAKTGAPFRVADNLKEM
ncbi:MAG: succinyl-CoA--3-ketoacid-CoA transferase [Oscillospiraceae bacterium]|nr:succinyl-CoA--3-ketoacid-CoA transferase [Oscillospiraceae bacterium]